MRDQKINLWQAPKEKTLRIVALDSTLDKKQSRRLCDLGLYNKSQVICIHRLPFGGPLVVQVGDNIFSLTKELASKILIENS